MNEIRNIVSDFIEIYDPHRSPANVVEELIKKLEALVSDNGAEVKRLRAFIQQTELADDVIYKSYKRLMTVLPECPEHGECIPYAIDWINSTR